MSENLGSLRYISNSKQAYIAKKVVHCVNSVSIFLWPMWPHPAHLGRNQIWQKKKHCHVYIYQPRHEKTCLMLYVKNKDTHQPAHLHSLISIFVFRCSDSWSGRFESYLVANPEDRFSSEVAQLYIMQYIATKNNISNMLPLVEVQSQISYKIWISFEPNWFPLSSR